MPSVVVFCPTWSPDTKEQLAQKMCAAVKRILQVPTVTVFFQEQAVFYVDGVGHEQGHVTLQLEGPDAPPAVIEELCERLCALVRQGLDEPRCEVHLVYHPNDHDHVGVNGVLLSTRKKGG